MISEERKAIAREYSQWMLGSESWAEDIIDILDARTDEAAQQMVQALKEDIE